jgi:hypothetical protein
VLEGNDPELQPHILKYRVSGAGHRYVSKHSLTTTTASTTAAAPAGKDSAVPSSGGVGVAAASDGPTDVQPLSFSLLSVSLFTICLSLSLFDFREQGSGVDDKLRPVDIAKLKADTIAQLKQHIFVHKEQLLEHFRRTYKDQLHITPEQWEHTLCHVIKLGM